METTQISTKKTPKIKLDFKDSKYATGRRKTSIAKIWLKKGSGKIYVNGKNYEDYFKRTNHKMQLLRPFEIINQATDYDVRCNVKGGGHTGQVGAMVHGISKALLQFDPDVIIVYDGWNEITEPVEMLQHSNRNIVSTFLKDMRVFLPFYNTLA